jgi:hypothetical protein
VGFGKGQGISKQAGAALAEMEPDEVAGIVGNKIASRNFGTSG